MKIKARNKILKHLSNYHVSTVKLMVILSYSHFPYCLFVNLSTELIIFPILHYNITKFNSLTKIKNIVIDFVIFKLLHSFSARCSEKKNATRSEQTKFSSKTNMALLIFLLLSAFLVNFSIGTCFSS